MSTKATILSDLTGRDPGSRNLKPAPVDLKRLRKGQRWLTATWRRLRDLAEWGPGEGAEFYKSLDAWDRKERAARDSGQLEGCPIGPGGCDPETPVRCGHCANAVADQLAIARAAEAPPGQVAMFGVGRGAH